MIAVIILRVVHHQVHAGGHVIVGGIAGGAAVLAVDDAVRSNFAPVRDPGGLAVGLMGQPHGGDELLAGLLDKALPVRVHVLDDAVLIVPAHGLGDEKPDVRPVFIKNQFKPLENTHFISSHPKQPGTFDKK